MRKLVFLFLIFALMGCSPLSKYEKYRERIGVLHTQLENNNDLSWLEKNEKIWSEAREEFPSLSWKIDMIMEKVKAISPKKESGEDITEDLKELNTLIGEYADLEIRMVNIRQQEFGLGLQMMSNSLNQTSQQFQRNAEMQNSLYLNTPRMTHCTTHLIGSTAYTNCY